MSELRIRQPTADEAAALAELHNTAWSETYADHFPPSAWDDQALTRRRGMWQRILADRELGFQAAVAEIDGELVGLALSARDSEEPAQRELSSIYLLQAAHGSGAGQALLDAVIGDAAATLWVLDGNPRARRFYERNGFRVTGERRASGFEGANDELRMRRDGAHTA